MKKIIIELMGQLNEYGLHYIKVDVYSEMFLEEGIETYVFCKHGDYDYDTDYYKNKGITLIYYNDFLLLEKEILTLNINNNIILLHTFTELLLDESFKLKEKLNPNNKINYDLFRNKNLQRKLLQDYNPEITVKFLEKNINDININEVVNYLGYPFIIKPSFGIQSAGVSKIINELDFNNYLNRYQKMSENLAKKGYPMSTLLLEEFIDGEMFSIDYYIDVNKKIYYSKPILIKLGTDLGIDDFFNYSRTASLEIENIFNNYNLKKFIEETVIATQVSETFIHHEFKLTTKGKLKTIELNGRIGGYRAEMYQEAYNLNLFKFPLGKDIKIKLDKNLVIILVYTSKGGILKSFNEKIFDKIGKMESFFRLNLIKSNIGKEVGLTKFGFSKVAVIKLKNKDINILNKDISYIEKNYSNLLILE